MIVSRSWLQKHVDAPLPDVADLADALTFHAFEIDATEGETLDVKVLPNRAADCLSHRGVAHELAAIIDLPLKPDPLRALPKVLPTTELVKVEVEDARACPRYMGALMKGVKVGPSPAWLKEALESIGQRSINNVVDATNYVMLDLGQPLHAFDASKMRQMDGAYTIAVRSAKEGEKTVTLSGEELTLPQGTLLITDSESIIGIAGVKGGKAAEISDATTDIILESATFNGPMVRRASQGLKLWTDASKRFQNDLSPELPYYAMDAVIALIKEIASGELVGVTDFYPAPIETVQVPCSVGRINDTLGTALTGDEVEGIFKRLCFGYKRSEDDFTVSPPFERRDILIPQDLVEEVGRIWGYDKLPSLELPVADAPDQARFRGIERVKDFLIEKGFTEISTQAFAKQGDIMLANPLDVNMPALRTSLKENMQGALARAKHYAPAILPPNQKPKLFEIGTVFTKDGEQVSIETSEPVSGIPEISDDNNYEPAAHALGAYKPFSSYPFIVRDIALWTPAGTSGDEVIGLIKGQGGALLARVSQFDRFEKDGRISYAFRLVFESMDRTLTDEEVNQVMEKVTLAVRGKGYEVR